MVSKTSTNNQSRIKEILNEILQGGFFDGKGKTTTETARKIGQRGFTIKGRKMGMVARMLTKMCQDPSTKLERDELPDEERMGGDKWVFRKAK